MQKHRRRLANGNTVALATPLMPFVKSRASDDLIDVDDSLYKFLSTKIPDKVQSQHEEMSVVSENDRKNVNVGNTKCENHNDIDIKYIKQENETNNTADSLGLSSLIKSENCTNISLNNATKAGLPNAFTVEKSDWFQNGLEVDDLLEEAEQLDWMQDSGTAYPDDVIVSLCERQRSRSCAVIIPSQLDDFKNEKRY